MNTAIQFQTPDNILSRPKAEMITNEFIKPKKETIAFNPQVLNLSSFSNNFLYFLQDYDTDNPFYRVDKINLILFIVIFTLILILSTLGIIF